MKDINKLTIEEKIGQMLMFAFHGTSYNQQLEYLIKKIKVGGIIHYARNLTDPHQANEINRKMQENSNIPLFIGLDQEGGTVMRITKDITPFPGAMALSATGLNTEELIYNAGLDLKRMNFNIVFAPVADINNNPNNPVINSRSYADNPKIVSKYVNYAVDGFQKAKILPTVKHFLGHGDTTVDSHISLPFVKKNKQNLYKNEIYPFEKAISNGADGIMISHIVFTAFDKENPASLSYEIMTNLLRKELKFDGLIVSDSLTMGAINSNYSKKDIILKAVNGGMDLLIFCGRANLDEQIEIYNIFVECVKNNLIEIDRINKSVARILRLKEKYAQEIYPEYTSPLNVNLGLEYSQKSVTLVKNNNLLPLKKEDKVLVIFPKIKLFSLVDNENSDYFTFKKIFSKFDFEVEEVVVSDDLSNLAELKNKVNQFTKIIFATYNIMKDDYQTRIYSLLDKNNTVVVSMRSPYDYIHLNNVLNYVCLYEATEISFQSFVKASLGLSLFTGKLPINLN